MQKKVRHMHFLPPGQNEQSDKQENKIQTEADALPQGVRINFASPSYRMELGSPLPTGSACLLLHFEFLGNTVYKTEGRHKTAGQKLLIPAGHYAIMYIPSQQRRPYQQKQSGFSVKINFSIPYLEQVLHGNWQPLGSLGEAICEEHRAVLGNKSYSISPAIKSVLKEIRHCTFKGLLKQVYLEGKLRELCCLLLDQYAHSPHPSPGSSPAKGIAEIRKIIDANIQHPYSIEELALLAGINRTKLQKVFREAHGRTIYEYIADLRMDRAIELLQSDRGIKIAEIARQVGYKNANHFSTAFKRKFGLIPRQQRGCYREL